MQRDPLDECDCEMCSGARIPPLKLPSRAELASSLLVWIVITAVVAWYVFR